jgi:predicted AAA+ superfamily ATPase
MRFVRDYLDTIVEHDIDQVSGAHRDPRLVRRFLHAYAQLTAHPAKVATIVARARGESDSSAPSRWTVEPYLDALRRMMIVDEVDAWDPALRSRARLTGGEKRHLGDPSLAAALMNCSPDRLLSDLKTFGFLFESLVTRDLRVYAEALGASVYHYREQSGRLEVDLVVEQADGAWAGFEVKLGGDAVDDAATALLRLASRVAIPPTALVVVTAGEYGYRRPDGVWVVPLGCLGP